MKSYGGSRYFAAAVVLFTTVALADPPDRRPLTFADLWAVKRVGPPSTSPDGKWSAVEVTTFDFEKNDSTSDVWLLATDGSVQKQATHAGKNSGPRWSPDGKTIAFTSKRDSDEVPQIYLFPIDGGEARRLTKMPFAPSALKWSADSKTVFCIGWTWPDAKDDAEFTKREKARKDAKVQAFVIDSMPYRYWDKWIADGKRPMVFAIDVITGKHRNLLADTGLTLVPTEPSANDYDVAPDGKTLAFAADSDTSQGRDSNINVYTLALNESGAKPINQTPDNPATDGNPVYSPDGKYIAYVRHRVKLASDSQRLHLLDHAARKDRPLTDALDRGVNNPKWFPDSKRLCFEADNQGIVCVYFVGIDGRKPFNSTEGLSERAMDPARTMRLSTFLRGGFDAPAAIYSHGPGQREPTQISKFNDNLVAQWKLGKTESTTFAGADGAKVQQFIFYPPDFDPNKKWPLIQMVHGGPHVGIVADFSYRWNPHLWAAKGYVVVQVNFHGSTGYGFKFTDSITGDFATKPMADVMASTEWFAKQPWIDSKRMAAAGGSYGGYMMAWLNGHTDRFAAMICHAGVYSYHGQMASDMVLGRERALGAPWTNMPAIDAVTAQRYSANFKSPTLVLHGEKDYRVPINHGLEYFNTLKLKGVPTRLVYFPDENHWVLKPQNSKLWHDEVFAWLAKYVGKGPS